MKSCDPKIDDAWRNYIPAWLKTCELTHEALARSFWWYASRKAKDERDRIIEILDRRLDDFRTVYDDIYDEITGGT